MGPNPVQGLSSSKGPRNLQPPCLTELVSELWGWYRSYGAGLCPQTQVGWCAPTLFSANVWSSYTLMYTHARLLSEVQFSLSWIHHFSYAQYPPGSYRQKYHHLTSAVFHVSMHHKGAQHLGCSTVRSLQLSFKPRSDHQVSLRTLGAGSCLRAP